MPVKKLPPDLTVPELVRYFAAEVGNGWMPPQYELAQWNKALKELKAEVDPFKLCLALELMARRWRRGNISVYEALSPGMLFHRFREMNFPDSYWKAVWYERCFSGDQLKQYHFYLTQYEYMLTTALAMGLASSKLAENTLGRVREFWRYATDPEQVWSDRREILLIFPEDS